MSTECIQEDQFRMIHRKCLERCVQNVETERVNQKGASGFEFKKKISFRKMTQTSNQKIEYEDSRQFLEHGLIL